MIHKPKWGNTWPFFQELKLVEQIEGRARFPDDWITSLPQLFFLVTLTLFRIRL